jgi:hypothetical protein
LTSALRPYTPLKLLIFLSSNNNNKTSQLLVSNSLVQKKKILQAAMAIQRKLRIKMRNRLKE